LQHRQGVTIAGNSDPCDLSHTPARFRPVHRNCKPPRARRIGSDGGAARVVPIHSTGN
jgi:hypothetical protein